MDFYGLHEELDAGTRRTWFRISHASGLCQSRTNLYREGSWGRPVKLALKPASPWPPTREGTSPSLPGEQAIVAMEGSEFSGSLTAGPPDIACNCAWVKSCDGGEL